MAVQLRKGGAVHFGEGSPACNPWKGDANYRAVDLEVTCKKCLTYMEKHAERIAAELEPVEGCGNCCDLQCDDCFPPYVPQVGDRIEDDHTAKLGQIRTVDAIRGHIASIRIEGPMFHAPHYGDEILNADGTFARSAIRKVETMTPKPVRTPSDCTTVQIGEQYHARQYNAFWTICGQDAHNAPAHDLMRPTCHDCIAIITEGREYAPKPGTVEPKRAKLRLSNAHVSLNHRGELVIIAEDALRGPVELSMNETDSRWLRACIGDMGPLSED